MKVFRYLIKAIERPQRVLVRIWVLMSKLIKSDKLYLSVYYYLATSRRMDFENPQTFTQKMQWLKLYNNSTLCTKLVDKYSVRSFIKEKIGEKYLFPLLGVWNSFDEIDFNALPTKFVLKTTHDSGGIVICKDKSKFNYNQAKRKISKSLKTNYFWHSREFPYKNVVPRVIAEKYMSYNDGSDLVDYKFFCFDGEPKILFFASERFSKKGIPPKFDYYDMDLNHLPIRSKGHENSSRVLKDIPGFEEMKEIARTLSKGFPFVRVDLYNIDGRIYFGEMTFHHDGGTVLFVPEEWDLKFGKMINLPIDC